MGISGRTAAFAPDGSVPVRARIAPQPAQRIYFPGRYLQSPQDGAAIPARRALLFSRTHARPWHLHRELPVFQSGGDRQRLHARGWEGDDGAKAEQPVKGPSPRITFRRLPYDLEKTIQKIYAISDLEPFLGDRLRQGR